MLQRIARIDLLFGLSCSWINFKENRHRQDLCCQLLWTASKGQTVPAEPRRKRVRLEKESCGMSESLPTRAETRETVICAAKQKSVSLLCTKKF